MKVVLTTDHVITHNNISFINKRLKQMFIQNQKKIMLENVTVAF